MSISSDNVKEACGVVGVYSQNEYDVARLAFFGLYALQHRGQESVGIATSDGKQIRHHNAMGLIAQAFDEEDLEKLTGHIAIGHTRYSTTGSNSVRNSQPILSKSSEIELALAHNGNLVNAMELRNELIEWGCTFTSSSDSEVIAHMMSNAPASNWEDRIAYCMRRLRGAYSLTVLSDDCLFAIRDPLGVRPLSIGKIDNGWVVASETCALDHIGATVLREVAPGEAVMINGDGITTVYQKKLEQNTASCIFEHIYFARPDSVLDGSLVYNSRMAMGAELAKQHPVDADLVIGIPDSAIAAAVGYSQQSGIPYGDGLVKNRYVGRTFINPDQRLRDLGVRTKFNPLPELISGKRLVVLDDSIVRGTTTPAVISLLRKGGAEEIHVRICAPPIISPCHLGVDFSTSRELLAANMTVEEIRDFLEVDSLGYLSHERLVEAVGIPMNKVCMGCFTGKHPIPVQLEMDKLAFEV